MGCNCRKKSGRRRYRRPPADEVKPGSALPDTAQPVEGSRRSVSFPRGE